MAMIMALTDDGNGIPRGPLAPLLIGLLIAVIGASMGPLTGFALNPARDFGPKLFTSLAGWGSNRFYRWAGDPLLSGAAAGAGGGGDYRGVFVSQAYRPPSAVRMRYR